MLWLGSQHPGFKVDTGVVRDRGAYLHQNNVAVAQLRDYPEARLRKQLAVVVLALIPPAVLAVVAAKVNAHLTLVEVKNDTQAVMHPMDELTPDQRRLPALRLDPDVLAGLALIHRDDCPRQRRFFAADTISNARRGRVVWVAVDDGLHPSISHRGLVVCSVNDEVLLRCGCDIAARSVFAIHDQAAAFHRIAGFGMALGRYWQSHALTL